MIVVYTACSFSFLVAFILGYVVKAKEKQVEKTINKYSTSQKQTSNTSSIEPGVIEYPSQSDIDYIESGEEKNDQARLELFKKYFTI